MFLQRALLPVLLGSLFVQLAIPVRAQISADGQPIGLSKATLQAPSIATVRLSRASSPSHSPTAMRDTPDAATLLPHTYGTETDVAIDVRAKGTAQRLPNGGRLWQLRITAPDAHGLRFAYDRFRLPPGATFFVYDARGTVIRGAFTARNNAPHGGFATDLTPGDQAILEYYEPPDAAFEGQIRIASVIRAQHRPHASAPLSDDEYEASALPCSINTACPESDAWTDEARATVLIDRGGTTCTGVLLNNTSEDFTPYILTAHHCGSPAVGDTLDWLVTFNYASPSCTDPETTPPAPSMTGVVVRAAGSGWKEDYALLELINPIPASYEPFFAGWSLADEAPALGTTVSHPRGDLRKITLDDNRLTDFGMRWLAAFDRGTIEGGSSGAPLFNEEHRLVGHLRGAWSLDSESCSGPDSDDNGATVVFPKLAHIWDAGAPGSRIADFLNPLGIDPTYLDGRDSAPPDTLAQPWISEIDTRTAETSESDDAEFIEIAGPAGLSLDGYRIDVYTCSGGTTRLHASETITDEAAPTLSDDHDGVGFFVIGGTGLDAPFADQHFATTNPDHVPDGQGLILLRDPAGREVFDYQYDQTEDGMPISCPPSRLTRSRGDDVAYRSTPGRSARSSNDRVKSTLGHTAIGFEGTTAPTTSVSGTTGITPSPGRKNDQAMPVELTRFEAVVNDAMVQLAWTTTSETNNAGFEIQGRMRGQADEWKNIAFVEGAGTTAEPQHYRHQIGDLAPGRQTFRLRQVDHDGTSSFSPEIEVQIPSTAPYQLSPPSPNPFRQKTTLTLTVAQSQHVEAELYDVLGRRVASLHDGIIRADEPTPLTVDAGPLPSGLYIVRLAGEQFTASRKITLLR